MLARRQFVLGLLAAPAIVRAMSIKPLPDFAYQGPGWVFDHAYWPTTITDKMWIAMSENQNTYWGH